MRGVETLAARFWADEALWKEALQQRLKGVKKWDHKVRVCPCMCVYLQGGEGVGSQGARGVSVCARLSICVYIPCLCVRSCMCVYLHLFVCTCDYTWLCVCDVSIP